MTKHEEIIAFILLITQSSRITIAKKLLTFKDFSNHLKIYKETYAEEITRRVFDYFIGNTIDLREEYLKYYRIEYKTIIDFLYNKYSVSCDDIQLIQKYIDGGYYLGFNRFHYGQDWDIDNLRPTAYGFTDKFSSAFGLKFIGEYNEN